MNKSDSPVALSFFLGKDRAKRKMNEEEIIGEQTTEQSTAVRKHGFLSIIKLNARIYGILQWLEKLMQINRNNIIYNFKY